MDIANLQLPEPVERITGPNYIIEVATDPRGRQLVRFTRAGLTYINFGLLFNLIDTADAWDKLPKLGSLTDCLPRPDDHLYSELCDDKSPTTPLWLAGTVDKFFDSLGVAL